MHAHLGGLLSPLIPPPQIIVSATTPSEDFRPPPQMMVSAATGPFCPPPQMIVSEVIDESFLCPPPQMIVSEVVDEPLLCPPPQMMVFPATPAVESEEGSVHIPASAQTLPVDRSGSLPYSETRSPASCRLNPDEVHDTFGENVGEP